MTNFVLQALDEIERSRSDKQYRRQARWRLITYANNETRLTIQDDFTPPVPDGAAKREGFAHLVYSRERQDSDSKVELFRKGYGVIPSPVLFTSRTKLRVKEAGAALEALYGKKIIFGTATAPHGMPGQTEAISAWSGKVIELLTQWIRDNAPDSGYVWCYERHKKGALHLHFAIGNQSVLLLRRLERGFRKYWIDLLDKLSLWSGVNMFLHAQGNWRDEAESVIRATLVPVKKSVVNYLSKYLSKDTSKSQSELPGPLRWAAVNSVLRTQIGKMRKVTVGDWQDFNRAITGWECIAAQLHDSADKFFSWRNFARPSNVTVLVYPKERECVNKIHDKIAVAKSDWRAATELNFLRQTAIIQRAINEEKEGAHKAGKQAMYCEFKDALLKLLVPYRESDYFSLRDTVNELIEDIEADRFVVL